MFSWWHCNTVTKSFDIYKHTYILGIASARLSSFRKNWNNSKLSFAANRIMGELCMAILGNNIECNQIILFTRVGWGDPYLFHVKGYEKRIYAMSLVHFFYHNIDEKCIHCLLSDLCLAMRIHLKFCNECGSKTTLEMITLMKNCIWELK